MMIMNTHKVGNRRVSTTRFNQRMTNMCPCALISKKLARWQHHLLMKKGNISKTTATQNWNRWTVIVWWQWMWYYSINKVLWGWSPRTPFVKTQRNSTQLKATLKQLALELDIVVTCSTPPHPTHYCKLLQQLESWNLAQTLTRHIWLW